MKTIKPGKASSLRHGGPKDDEKMKNFMNKVNQPTDIFGKPKELTVARDATYVKPPILEHEQAESNSDQTTGGRMLEQIGQGIRYVGKKTLEGMANAVEGF